MAKVLSMDEKEMMIKRDRHNLSVSTMAEISGLKGTQFGKEIFVSLIKFKDLMNFLNVFPEVQRKVKARKVGSIRNYILTGIDSRTMMRFFPAITVTARGNIFYDAVTNRLAIDTNKSKLSINDGQHRFYGVESAIKTLDRMVTKEKDHAKRHKYLKQLEDLENMVLPITIFNNLTEKEEKQLFSDTNNLASRPSKGASLRLVQSDMYAKLARDLAKENKSLSYYGVEVDKLSIQKQNKNLVLLTTIYQCIKELYMDQVKSIPDFLNEHNYDEIKKEVSQAFDSVFSVLPTGFDDKEKYIVFKNYTLKGIFKFLHSAKLYELSEEETYGSIGKLEWTHDVEYWKQFGGIKSANGNLMFGGGGDNAKNTIHDAILSVSPVKSNDLFNLQ